MHHVMMFMLIKMILAGIAAHTGFCADFDLEQYRTNIDYIYLVRGVEHFKMVYLAAGIAIPLLLRYALGQWMPAKADREDLRRPIA